MLCRFQGIYKRLTLNIFIIKILKIEPLKKSDFFFIQSLNKNQYKKRQKMKVFDKHAQRKINDK